MYKEHFEYLSNDGITMIHAVKWIPAEEITAILQISHGMVEFIERYDEFAEYLCERNILVVGNDHLGHGNSIQSKEHYGYFADERGNECLVKDIHKLRKQTGKEYPGIPYYLLGHSMGSFLARQYLCSYGSGLSGAIIMGTGYYPKGVLLAGLVLCEALAKRSGWHARSKLMQALVFGQTGMKLKNPRTNRDWLTKDTQIVDDYINDERCQFTFSLNAYHNMFLGIYQLTSKAYLAKMPNELPILFVSGEEDPIGSWGKGVKKVYKQFVRTGMKAVTCKLYPDDRHEILNELDRKRVFEDIYKWMKKH